MTNDTPTLQLAVWDDPLAANGLQTDTDDALIFLPGRRRLRQPSDLVVRRRVRRVTCGLSDPRSRAPSSVVSRPCLLATGDRKLSIHLSIYCALLHDVQRDQTRRT